MSPLTSKTVSDALPLSMLLRPKKGFHRSKPHTPNPPFVHEQRLVTVYVIHSRLTAAPTTRAIASHDVQYCTDIQ